MYFDYSGMNVISLSQLPWGRGLTVWTHWIKGQFTSQAWWDRLMRDFSALLQTVSNLRKMKYLFLEFSV